MKATTVERFMTRHPFVISPETTLAMARRMMLTHRVRHLPVEDSSGLVGILTERNVAFAFAERAGIGERRVRGVFIDEPYAVTPHDDVCDVIETMGERNIGSAIVVRAGKIEGIFTLVDVCRVFASALRSTRAV